MTKRGLVQTTVLAAQVSKLVCLKCCLLATFGSFVAQLVFVGRDLILVQIFERGFRF